MGLNSVYKFEDQLSILWDIKILAGNAEKLQFKVEDCSLPFYKFDVERKFSQETVFKKVENLDEVSITFRESNDHSTFDFFYNWMSKFYSFEDRVFRSFSSIEEYNKYLFSIDLYLYKPGYPIGMGIPFRENDYSKATKAFHLTRCKPIGIDTVSFDYSTGSALKYSVSFLPEEIQPLDEMK